VKLPLNVLDFLHRAEVAYGDRTGITDEPDQPASSWGDVSWQRVGELARAQAAGLDALGVLPGERVAIVSQNAARMFVSMFGVPGYGRTIVPINFRLGPDEVAYIVEHSGASVLLIDPELDELYAGVKAPYRFVLGAESDEVLYRFDAEPRPWADADEDATASINYTSGTTARPKGVQATHRNLWLNAVALGWQTGINDRDRYLWTVPMFHCNGWGMVFAVTGMGGRHVMLRKVDGPEILRRIDQHGVTCLGGAPAVVNMVLDAAERHDGPPAGRDRVRMIIGGAPPPSRTFERIETELGWEPIQIYGLTETSPMLTLNRRRPEWDGLSSADRARQLIRAGIPALGVRLATAPDGEVLARSNVVFDGYWRQPEATAEAMAGGWFHTGDGGHIDDEGYVTISDRKKDVIITGGENVSSIEVEDCLFQHPAVAEAAVIGVPDDRWGETVKAIVVLKPGVAADEGEIIAHCRGRMAHFKCPSSVEIRDELARTVTGKVQKFKLRAPYWEGRARMVS
jgi:fatty-acyl-CoA synthase